MSLLHMPKCVIMHPLLRISTFSVSIIMPLLPIITIITTYLRPGNLQMGACIKHAACGTHKRRIRAAIAHIRLRYLLWSCPVHPLFSSRLQGVQTTTWTAAGRHGVSAPFHAVARPDPDTASGPAAVIPSLTITCDSMPVHPWPPVSTCRPWQLRPGPAWVTVNAPARPSAV